MTLSRHPRSPCTNEIDNVTQTGIALAYSVALDFALEKYGEAQAALLEANNRERLLGMLVLWSMDYRIGTYHYIMGDGWNTAWKVYRQADKHREPTGFQSNNIIDCIRECERLAAVMYCYGE